MNEIVTGPLGTNKYGWLVGAAPFAAALLGPFLPLLIVFAGTLPASAPHPNRIFVLSLALLAGVALLATVAGLALAGIRRFPKSLWLPMAALLVAQLIALIFAVDRTTGIFAILTQLAGFAVLIATNEALATDSARRGFLACYLSSAIVAAAIACALSVMKLPPAMFAYEHGRASGTFLQPNELAGYMLWVVPIGLAQVAAPRWLRVIGLAGAAAGAFGLVLSVSRAAIISLVLALVLFVRKFGRRATIAYVTIAVLAMLLLATVFRDVAHDPSENASRLAVWAGALRVAQRFALTGVGPFGFHSVYPHYRLPQSSANEVHAHDLPLQIVIEYGVIGLAAFAWFVIAAARACARVGKALQPKIGERSLLFAALICGFAATALQNTVDVVTTFLLVIAWPMLGLTLALGPQETRTT